MKKLCFIFTLFCAFLLASCSGNKSSIAMGELDGVCFPNKTCNEGLTCDEESNLCMKIEDISLDDSDSIDTDSDSEPTDATSDTSDSADDLSDSLSDDTDTATDTTNPDNDSDADQWRKQGELYGECYPNETCNKGLICDVDNNVCIKDPRNSEESKDDSDNTEKPDENSTDIIDNDLDTTDDDDSDAPDSESASPCDSDPCSGINYSTGSCTMTDEGYACGCIEHYSWNGSICKKLSDGWKSLGEICTAQTSCYNNSDIIPCPILPSDDFFGQDAHYMSKCKAQSFASSSKLVVDNNTGLTWEKSPSTDSYTWDDANNHCADLNSSNYGGKSNWRLPNPLEFMTIVDNSKSNPATNSNFTGIPTNSSIFANVFFWTSKEYKGDTNYAYIFSPQHGLYNVSVNNDLCLKTQTYNVICVSGDEMQPAKSDNFTTQTISEAVVVTDSATGLMWQKEYETNKTWQEALKYCEDSTYAGYSDWRVPNKNELASLVNYEKSDSPYSYFPDMPSHIFCSSSTRLDSAVLACLVSFDTGIVTSNTKTSKYYVRCVRNAD